MLLASVKSGHYLIIEEDKVIAKVWRRFKPAPKHTGARYWSDGYDFIWLSTGVVEKFRSLAEIHEIYHMTNFPGYGHVLKERNA